MKFYLGFLIVNQRNSIRQITYKIYQQGYYKFIWSYRMLLWGCSIKSNIALMENKLK